MNNLDSITHNDGTQAKSQSAKVPILGGLCRLYQRPNSSYWWALFSHKGCEVRTSTKQTELKDAERAATQWYIAKQAEINNGFAVATKDRSFVVMAKKAIEAYDEGAKRGKRSPSYVKALEKLLRGLTNTVGLCRLER